MFDASDNNGHSNGAKDAPDRQLDGQPDADIIEQQHAEGYALGFSQGQEEACGHVRRMLLPSVNKVAEKISNIQHKRNQSFQESAATITSLAVEIVQKILPTKVDIKTDTLQAVVAGAISAGSEHPLLSLMISANDMAAIKDIEDIASVFLSSSSFLHIEDDPQMPSGQFELRHHLNTDPGNRSPINRQLQDAFSHFNASASEQSR